MTPSSGESLPSDRASTEPFPLFPPQHLSDSHNDIGTSSALPDNVASQSLSHNPIRLRKPSDHIVKLPGDNTGPAFATSSAMRDPNPPPQVCCYCSRFYPISILQSLQPFRSLNPDTFLLSGTIETPVESQKVQICGEANQDHTF